MGSNSDRVNFGSRLGVILATAGSAVGLGNVWRFPYMAGNDGGAAFILIYVACVLFLGIPGMIAEFVVGRHSASNAARSYRKMSKGGGWGIIGYMGVLTSMLILGFYSVVAGWCLQYLGVSITGSLSGGKEAAVDYFATFSSDPVRPSLTAVAFVLVTHYIVAHGIRDGIERASKLLMPALFVLLIVIVAASCSLPGSLAGVEFLLKPDFSRITPGVMLDALGQAFFSLSLGTACLCTYASYFDRHTNLGRSAVNIALIDVVVAVLAGLMIFPAAFSVGVNPDSGPSLIFITLPSVFHEAFSALPWLGYVVSVMFYALMSLAALTSTISMHEIGTAFFHEEFNISRSAGAWVVTGACCLLAVLSSLSLGAVDGLTVFGLSLMDAFDFVTGQILLPFGSFLTCVFVGWRVSRGVSRDEFLSGASPRGAFFGLWYFAVRYVCPVAIVIIFLHQFGVFDRLPALLSAALEAFR